MLSGVHTYILELLFLLPSSVLLGVLSYTPIRHAIKKALIFISVMLNLGQEKLRLGVVNLANITERTPVETFLLRQ